MENSFIVCAGNIADGFVFHGPFDSLGEAAEWGDKNVEPEYWIATLHAASTQEPEK